MKRQNEKQADKLKQQREAKEKAKPNKRNK
jgi:hypothetical protein